MSNLVFVGNKLYPHVTNLYEIVLCTLLKIKVLHDAIEEPFLTKWFHKEPLTSEESFCFTKGSLWQKKVLQIIKRSERDSSSKNLWLNGSLWNQKWFFYGIAVKNLLSTFNTTEDILKNVLLFLVYILWSKRSKTTLDPDFHCIDRNVLQNIFCFPQKNYCHTKCCPSPASQIQVEFKSGTYLTLSSCLKYLKSTGLEQREGE